MMQAIIVKNDRQKRKKKKKKANHLDHISKGEFYLFGKSKDDIFTIFRRVSDFPNRFSRFT